MWWPWSRQKAHEVRQDAARSAAAAERLRDEALELRDRVRRRVDENHLTEAIVALVTHGRTT